MTYSFLSPQLRTVGVAAMLSVGALPALAQPGGGPPAPASADTLGIYTFTGAMGNEATFAADAQPTGATFAPMRRGGGVTASQGANAFAATGWTASAAPDTAQFFAFRLTADAGRQFDLDTLFFAERRSATGIRMWEVRSSVDGYAAPLAMDSVPDDTNFRPHTVALGQAFGALTSVEFRIYGYTAEAAAGSWRVDNVGLIGTIGTAAPTGPTVQFAVGTRTVGESAGSVPVSVSISNPSTTAATTVQVALGQPGGSATSGADYTFAPQTLTFPAGSVANQQISVPITDDAAVEGDETIVFALLNPSTGVSIGTPATMTVTIFDNDSSSQPTQTPPRETIAAVTPNDSVGVPARLNELVRVRGVVSSPNTRTTGYSFGLQDATGGVLIFSAMGVGPTPPLVFTPGDEVEVVGRVIQFNGLTELVPDSLLPIGTAQPLPTPVVVTTLSEATESEIIRLANPVSVVNPAQWTNMGSGFNVDVTDGTTTYQLRVVRGTDVYGSPVPTGTFRLTGLGGQFDNSSPYFEGYQISPRFLTDIVADTATPGGPKTVQFATTGAGIIESPNPVTVPVTVTNPDSVAVTVTVLLDLNRSTATLGTDFTYSPVQQVLTIPAGVSQQTLTINVLDDAITEGPETVVLRLSGPVNTTVGADTLFTLTILDNDSTLPATPPLRPIADVVTIDGQGVATLDGQAVRVRGIVTSPNIRTTGYSVTIQDASGRGITVFSTTTLGTQTINQGDEIEVVGLIDQFNGLTEIIPDSFRTIRTAQPLPAARVVTALGETTESELVKLNGPLTIPNPAQWTNATGGFTVDVTDGTTTFALRVPRGSALIGTAAPTTAFRLTGTGGQFDNSAPFLDGYQLIPRSASDIELVTGLSADGAAAATVALYPNPATDRLTVQAPFGTTTATVLDAVGRPVHTIRLTNGAATVSVAELAAGVYVVRAGTAVRRFVKE